MDAILYRIRQAPAYLLNNENNNNNIIVIIITILKILSDCWPWVVIESGSRKVLNSFQVLVNRREVGRTLTHNA